MALSPRGVAAFSRPSIFAAIFITMDPVQILGLKEMAFRLTMAVVVGGLLGLNRELRGKPAGLSTNALVALGAAIAAMLSLSCRAARRCLTPVLSAGSSRELSRASVLSAPA